MSTAQIEIQLIGSVVAIACALPGVFLVLRRMAMMSDAISHTVLLGIVIAFFVTEDINSPWLIIGAALMGLITVALVELLNRTNLVKEDASIGLIFPFLFSIAVIMISRYAGDVHLDTDAVLLGELVLAPFNRFRWLGIDWGPAGLITMSVILVINILFIVFFYKELKIATFDAGLAATLGLAPSVIHYGLMGIVSITAVGAFDAVGSILVVAMMIAPPVSAYLLTDRLPRMLGLSALIGVMSAVGGYWLARSLDASIAGSMATMAGVLFLLTFLFAPERGMVALARRRNQQRWTFAQTALTIHLLNHEDSPNADEECRVNHLQDHLHWDVGFAQRVIEQAEQRGLIWQESTLLRLTDEGRLWANQTLGVIG
ncbi:MAG: metal ABC transporter permease [Chloroflexota bacterium]